ncbi:MAG TPA: MerR family transcriptional regulator [Kofleriaceae bacterium]|nr:MerR family transcriptional regulator [Kofleriaceae bacterium]
MAIQRSVLRIGELAHLAGLSPDTLRHYERLGLLAAARTPGRFREYGADAIRRVEMIQAALAIGFTLAELSEIVAERAAGRAPCHRVRALAADKLVELTERIAELSRLRARLQRTLAAWDDRLATAPSGAAARLLESLVGRDPAPRNRSRRAAAWRSPSTRGRR